MYPAVFMDRDGTISEEMGHVNHIDRFRMFASTPAAIRRLNEAGVRAVVVTNQGGVARGLFPESLIQVVHSALERALAECRARLDGIYYCPHHPEGVVECYSVRCECRKPRSGMILRAADDLNIDLSRSFTVGDKYSDVETGFRTGARGVLVLTGYGKGEWEYNRNKWPRPPDYVSADLPGAIGWILEQAGSGAGRRP
jgi:D-glycero-D-manno-heptose 1,7-bisphosphate phosphatase